MGDRKGVAGTVRFLAQLAYRDGDFTHAQALSEEGLAIEQELGSSERVAEALGFLGTIAERTGHVRRARRLFQESLASYAKGGNRSGADEVLRRLLDLDSLPDGAR